MFKEKIPKIKYLDGNIERTYYPDFYIPETNTIYEVKSKYTLNKNKKINEIKFQAVVDSGYNFELKVY